MEPGVRRPRCIFYRLLEERRTLADKIVAKARELSENVLTHRPVAATGGCQARRRQ